MIDKYNDTTSKDNQLGFAINQAIDNLQNIVKDLPYGATNEELKETIKQTDTVLYTLISAVDKVDRAITEEEKPKNNVVEMVIEFFDNRRAI